MASIYRFLRYHTLNYPFLVCGTAFAVAGMGMVLLKRPIRYLFNIQSVEPIPITYPMPERARFPPSGYSDEEYQWPAIRYQNLSSSSSSSSSSS